MPRPRPLPKWAIPMSDGYAPVLVTIRDTVVPPCVHVDLALPGRLLTPLESMQLGLAMQEAGRVAGLGRRDHGRRQMKERIAGKWTGVMTLTELRARVMVGVENAPPPFPVTPKPADEIKVSHINLMIKLTLEALGIAVAEREELTRPPRAKPRTKRKRKARR